MRAGRRLDHLGVVEMGRRARDGGELRRELAEHEVLAAPLDEAERGGVPERGGAAVAEQDLVAVGKGVERRRGPRAPAERPTTPSSRRWLVPRYPPAACGEPGQRLGPHLRRPRAEAAVGRDGARGGRTIVVAVRSDRATRRAYRDVRRAAPRGRSRSSLLVPARALHACPAGADRAAQHAASASGSRSAKRMWPTDREPDAEREPVVHERRAGAHVERERLVPLHDRAGAEHQHDRRAEERRVELLARVELAEAHAVASTAAGASARRRRSSG